MLIYSIEDDLSIAKIIKLTLKQQGYNTEVFSTYKEFSEALSNKLPDLILVDMMLPDVHGLDIIKEIRKDKKCDNIDIIVISADTLLLTKLDSFDLGADDYIEKPFDILELTSRINARFRKRIKTLTFASFILNESRRSVTKDDIETDLTEKEYEILKLLIKNKNTLVTREELLNTIWGTKEIETRALDMHVKSIRKKLNTDKIQTVYASGYKIVE